MSSGPPARKPKPRSRSASWKLDSPRSNRAPSTAPKPAAGATVAELAEVGLAKDESVAVARAETGLDTGDRGGVGIETQEAAIGIGRLQDPLGVPTAAQGGIDVKAAGSRREHLDDLVHQHRQVPFVHLSSIPNESDPERILEAHMVRS